MSDKRNRRNYKYKAVIIGAGRIASEFDDPKSVEILTHAHAYTFHKQTELMGFLDIKKNAAVRAVRKWGGRAFFDADELFNDAKPDIVSICTPDKNHFTALKKAAEYRPKLVICEKPLTLKIDETEEIIALYKKLDIPLLINYSRRFDKALEILRDQIVKKNFGEILSAAGIYTKGILHNGSHLLDLCRFLFGEAKNFQALYAVSDYDGKDLSIGGFIEFERCKQMHLMVGNAYKYSIFELDILFEKGRVRLPDSGLLMEERSVAADSLYRGYYILGESLFLKTGFNMAMYNLIDNAVNFLENAAPLICDASEAGETQRFCEALKNNWEAQK